MIYNEVPATPCGGRSWKEGVRRSMKNGKATPNDHSTIKCRAFGSERGNTASLVVSACPDPMVGGKLMDVLIYENYAEKKRPGHRSSVKN